MYDVVYLTDFVDIKNNQLTQTFPGYLLLMHTVAAIPPKELWVCVYVEMHVQLRGETDQELMHVYTNNFDMIGQSSACCKQFCKRRQRQNPYTGRCWDTYVENAPLRQRLQDMASKNPTAPPGKYTIMMRVLSATSKNPNDRGVPNTVPVSR